MSADSSSNSAQEWQDVLNKFIVDTNTMTSQMAETVEASEGSPETKSRIQYAMQNISTMMQQLETQDQSLVSALRTIVDILQTLRNATSELGSIYSPSEPFLAELEAFTQINSEQTQSMYDLRHSRNERQQLLIRYFAGTVG